MTVAYSGVLPSTRVSAIGALFFFSGFSSLVYQVVWMRELALFFGSDIYSAAITLSAFMGGLSLGALLSSRITARIHRPLVAYGVIEIVIGVYAILFPYVLSAFEPFYRTIYENHFTDAPSVYHGFRSLIAVVNLLLPTVLMGATLPLVVQGFVRHHNELGEKSGFFYSVNTLGALAGTLVVGFILLPALGVTKTLLAGFVINTVVGVAAIAVGWRTRTEAAERIERGPQAHSAAAKPIVLLVIAVSGAAALAFEVVWIRVLAQAFSATAYSFSIMLASFLFGIYYGSLRVSRTLDQNRDPARLLALLELWAGATVAMAGVAIYLVPEIFGPLIWSLTGITGGAFGIASVIANIFVSLILVAVPTLLLGATFPVAVKVYAPDVSSVGRHVGAVYAANTAGAIIGALAGGFALIPLLGTAGSIAVIAVVFALAGIVIEVSRRRQNDRVALAATLAPLGLMAGLVVCALLLPPQIVANYGMQKSTTPEVIYHAEGIGHTVSIVRNETKHVIMMVDGNVEADTTLIQRRHFVLKGHMPLLLHPEPKSVAVVGLGLGITLTALDRHPTVDRIKVIELNPGMVKAHRYLEDITGGVLKSRKLDLQIDDGRNFMAMTSERFDLVTADPIHPRISGVGYLYTKEYYESIRRRLQPGGIICQWMPMYSLSPRSFDAAFRTFAEVFPQSVFIYVRGHGLFIAGDDKLAVDIASLRRRFADPAVAADLRSIGIGTADDLLGHILMGPRQIAAYLNSRPHSDVNTDDNAYLEYRTPFEFLGMTEAIARGLIPFAGLDRDVFKDASAADMTAIAGARQRRIERIIPELSEKID